MSKPTKKGNPWSKRILIAILVLAAIAAGVYWYVATEEFSDTKDRKAAYTINAYDFIKEFKGDEKVATKKYDGKILTVNGIASAVELADTTINIKIIDSATRDYIIFTFQTKHVAEAKNVKPGDSVSIKAAYSDYVYSEILEAYSITFQRSTLNK